LNTSDAIRKLLQLKRASDDEFSRLAKDVLEELAASAVEAERAACEKICDDAWDNAKTYDPKGAFMAELLADRISARGGVK